MLGSPRSSSISSPGVQERLSLWELLAKFSSRDVGSRDAYELTKSEQSRLLVRMQLPEWYIHRDILLPY